MPEPNPARPKPNRPWDLSRPIPSWNTLEYLAEWPGDDEMSALPRHGLILNYLLTVLTLLLRQSGRPFGVNQDIGLHFVDANSVAQKCKHDLIVMPFPNTGNSSLSRRGSRVMLRKLPTASWSRSGAMSTPPAWDPSDPLSHKSLGVLFLAFVASSLSSSPPPIP